MKDEYFDSDLELEDSVLPKVGPAEDADTEGMVSLPPAVEETPRKRQIMGYDLSTLLIAGTALIALTVYAVWPDSPPPQAFIPDNTIQQAPLNHAEPPFTPPTPEVTDTDPPSQMDTADTMPPAVTEKETDEIRQYGVANREAITTLNGRLSNAERRLALLEDQLRSQQQRAPLTSTATATRSAKATTTPHRVKRTDQSTAVARSTGSVKGWRVHTLYPGMAWITHSGSTWSVRPGDVLQGLTIRSIDIQRRVVVTDKGNIRQED